jgi:hypothetical protein
VRIRPSIVWLGLLCVGLLGTAPAGAEEAPPDEATVSDAERDQAIEKGLAYLERTSLGLLEAQGTPRKQFTVAATGYVFLLARRTRGLRTEQRSDRFRRVTDYLLGYLDEVERRSADDGQLPPVHGLATSEALAQYTWPLAMMAMYFTELHAQGRQQRTAAKAVDRIVKVLGEAQDPNGGWGHGRVSAAAPDEDRPHPLEDQVPESMRDLLRSSGGGYPSTLLASSILVASSLGIVRSALDLEGLDYLDRTPAYFHEAQLSNGLFPYDPSQRSAHADRTGAGRTAGSIFALYCLGVPLDHATIQKARRYLGTHLPDVAEGHGSAALNLLYGALASRVLGDEAWGRFKETFFRRLVDAQADRGSFTCICEGRLFGATNDSRPAGAGAVPRGPFQEGVDAYVSVLHTWILLLDLGTPATLEEPPARGPVRPVTPR